MRVEQEGNDEVGSLQRSLEQARAGRSGRRWVALFPNRFNGSQSQTSWAVAFIPFYKFLQSACSMLFLMLIPQQVLLNEERISETMALHYDMPLLYTAHSP